MNCDLQEEDAMSEGTVAIECSKQSTFLVQKKENLQPLKNNISQQTATKKKNKSKKGGLSMFLSGALDDNPKDVAPPPPTPRSEGPVWGGAKVSKGPASLREIQDEQSKIKVNQPTRNKDQFEDLSNSRNEGKVLLSSFLTSKPIPVVSTRAQQASDGEKGTPPWAAPGTPPSLSRPSLRDIQMQQVCKLSTPSLCVCMLACYSTYLILFPWATTFGTNVFFHIKQGKQHSLSHTPKTRTAGFSVTSSQGSPSDSPGMNRWFKPEIEAPSSIRSIQIEEKAMRDLKRFYSSVKIVRNQS